MKFADLTERFAAEVPAMTRPVITDEIREIGRKALEVFWDDAPARQIGLAADTFLEAVAPMILEEAAKVVEDKLDDGYIHSAAGEESHYSRGFQTGITETLAVIRALKGGE